MYFEWHMNILHRCSASKNQLFAMQLITQNVLQTCVWATEIVPSQCCCTILPVLLEALVLPRLLSLSVVSLTFGGTGVLQGTSMCRAAASLETRVNRA